MRNKLKYALLGAVFALPVIATVLSEHHARAQTIPVPGGTVLTNPARFQTYSGTYTAVTTAASATDIAVLGGSATKTVYARKVVVCGTSTADGSSTLALIKRSTADSAGTPITPSATAGGQKVPLDSGNAAATATWVAYSANPTVGTAVGIVASGKLSTSVAATSGTGGCLVFEFGANVAQNVTLRGVAQQLALSGLGSSLVAGAVISVTAEWMEQ